MGKFYPPLVDFAHADIKVERYGILKKQQKKIKKVFMDAWQKYKKAIEMDTFSNTLAIMVHVGVLGLLPSLVLYIKFPTERVMYLALFFLVVLYVALIIIFFSSPHDKGQQKGVYISLFFVLVITLLFYSFIYRGNIVASEAPGEPVTDMKTCLYFSIVTFTTLGYGDFTPTANIRLLAASEAILGYVFLGLLIATTVSYLKGNSKQ